MFKNYRSDVKQAFLFIGLFILAGYFIWFCLMLGFAFSDGSEKAGQFGDSFGPLSCVFTAAAFLGVLHSIWVHEANREKGEERRAVEDERWRRSQSDARIAREQDEARWEQAKANQEELRAVEEAQRRLENQRAHYATLLSAIEYQIKAISIGQDHSTIDPTQLGELQVKLRTYSAKLEQITLDRPDTRLLSDADIIHEFSKIRRFETRFLESGVDDIRKRLSNARIFDPETLSKLIKDERIHSAISRIYREEFPGTRAGADSHSVPFDPHALPAWGGVFLHYGFNDNSIATVTESLRQSTEWHDARNQAARRQ